jgi:hypothetical protein
MGGEKMCEKQNPKDMIIGLKMSTFEAIIDTLRLSVKLIESYSETAQECRKLLDEIKK